MSQQQKTDLDDFMEALENMMDSRDDMWEEQKYSNISKFLYIKEHRYEPAKKKVREILDRIIWKATIFNT
jgi:hypothetical protein